jgi:hypothetical protein
MRRWLRPLWIVLALVFLLEAWLWDHLEPIVARAVNLVPWGRIKARLVQLIERLPPWATLIVFVVPIVVLFPIKLAGLWLLARGHWLVALATFMLAKLIGLGITAFIFDVTRDKLLQMAWFRRLYEWVLWLRGWAHDQVEPIKQRLRGWAHDLVEPVRQRLRSYLWLLKPRRAGRFLRRLARIRRRMRARTAL